MTAGCGDETAKLERLERKRAEIAAEQAHVGKLGRQKGVWERFTTHVYNNAWTCFFSATAFVAVGSIAAII